MNRDTQERIIEAAAELFSTKGYHQTTVDDIAERAGVAKGSVYYNYKGKSALLVCVIREGIDFVRRQVAEKTPACAGPRERLEILIGTAFDVMAQYHSLVGFALSGACDGVEEEAKEQIQAARREIQDDFASLIAEGVEAGAIRPLPAHLCAQILLGALERCIKICVDGESSGSRPTAEVKSALLTLFFEGLAALDDPEPAR